MNAYTTLEQEFTRLYALKSAMAVLDWDSATMMPSGSSEVRGEQLATLAGLAHDIVTSPRIADLLDKAESESGLDDWQRANLYEMRQRYRHENAVPADLVVAASKACSASEHYWRTARKENDITGFLKHLEIVLGHVREIAAHKAEALQLAPYDALIDQYDPGSRMAKIDVYFAPLETFLPGFIPEVLEHQKKRPTPAPLTGHFPTHKQKELGIKVMQALGFDFTRGRLDESIHPFCGGVSGDVRITTRYQEKDFIESLYGVVHETGHALYDMGLPKQWRTQPVGEPRGMAVHESQSLLVEMQLARSREFLTFALPLMKESFGDTGWDVESVYRALTVVQPSLIRVSADEVTYPCHILLRYDLEKKLISGALAVKDLPEAWAQGMKALLGITPDSHANGCMQDIHWPGGTFGYFPSYTLGAMMAAQLFDSAGKNIKDLALSLKQGNFAPLTGWLGDRVHRWGSCLSTEDLLVEATGKPLDAQIFIAHLKQRYLS